MIRKLIGEYVPYPPPNNYDNKLKNWLKNNPIDPASVDKRKLHACIELIALKSE